MTPKQLKDLFRREMDDVPEHPDDTSGCLWSDEEIYGYLSEAQQILVYESRYLFQSVEVIVPANLSSIDLPRRLIDARDISLLVGDKAYPVERVNLYTVTADVHDYGRVLSTPAAQRGSKLRVTLDLDSDRITILPPQQEDIRLTVNGYVEADPIVDSNSRLDVRNPRHQRVMLKGAKAMAYDKHDSEVHNPNQVAKLEAEFYGGIREIHGERLRRRREPGTIKYGGL